MELLLFRLSLLVALLRATQVAGSLAEMGPLPFVVLHGISDECKHHGIQRFMENLSNMSGASGYCIEIGNGAMDSWFMPFNKQVELACNQIRASTKLQSGYNIVGLSQGNLIGRGLIEWCDGPPVAMICLLSKLLVFSSCLSHKRIPPLQVNNFISLGGPHAGIASIPMCAAYSFCTLADLILKLGIYSPYVQSHLAPAGYIKMPLDLDAYYRSCVFLPKLNNELAENRNWTFRRRLSQLNQLVLVKFDKDTVLVPPETAWFGYFPPGDLTKVLPMNETALYREDWIGLKPLAEAGRIRFLTFSGEHLSISEDNMRDHIAPYLRQSKASSSS